VTTDPACVVGCVWATAPLPRLCAVAVRCALPRVATVGDYRGTNKGKEKLFHTMSQRRARPQSAHPSRRGNPGAGGNGTLAPTRPCSASIAGSQPCMQLPEDEAATHFYDEDWDDCLPFGDPLTEEEPGTHPLEETTPAPHEETVAIRREDPREAELNTTPAPHEETVAILREDPEEAELNRRKALQLDLPPHTVCAGCAQAIQAIVAEMRRGDLARSGEGCLRAVELARQLSQGLLLLKALQGRLMSTHGAQVWAQLARCIAVLDLVSRDLREMKVNRVRAGAHAARMVALTKQAEALRMLQVRLRPEQVDSWLRMPSWV
jgi:hypothetical protein